MTFNQIKYFEAICRCGGVTAAARALHISQPSVSASLRELEEEFGVNLFSRMGKKLYLTKEGEYFLSHCSPILEDCERLCAAMADFGESKNRIQIGVPPMIGTSVYPKIYREFSQAFPNVRADIWEQSSRQSCKMVELESLDVAIAILAEVDTSIFESQKLLTTEICFCVKNDSNLAKFKTISPFELEGYPLAMFKEGNHVDVVLENFKKCSVAANIVVASNQLQTIMQFAKEGLAGAFLFAELAQEGDGLAAIPLDERICVDIGLVWKRDRHMNGDTARFIKSARETAKSLSI